MITERKLIKLLQTLIQCNCNGIYRYSLFTVGIYTEIEINSSVEHTYKTLLDFQKYNQWNPAIKNIQGIAQLNCSITADIQWPGLNKNSYTLLITELIPERKIRWIGRFGHHLLFKGDHTFLIDQTSAENTILLKHVEIFTGFLVPFLYPFLRHNIYLGFININQALKKHLEKI